MMFSLSKINFESKRVQGLVGITLGLFLKWWEAANGIALPVVEVPILGATGIADAILLAGAGWWGVVGNGHAAIKAYKAPAATTGAPQ